MGLHVTDLTKGYTRRGEKSQALRGVSFEAPTGAFVTLLGPSGCGKSTLLNLLAGLDTPSSGRIDINGHTVYDGATRSIVPAAKRNISMVFQSYAIWPHMTVRENVTFPLLNGRLRSGRRADLLRAADEALEKVHLAHLADRPAPLLSGGQQQRVALARAIAQSPSLILLDEPLSNLDANLRDAMQKQIRDVVSQAGITTVYVTHDQKEALAMSDMIIVMNEGLIEQIGTPQQIYYEPGTRFVARFMGAPNLIEASVTQCHGGQVLAHCALGPITFSQRADVPKPGDKVILVLRQEDFELEAAAADNRANCYELPLRHSVFLGERMELVCGTADPATTVSVYVNARAVDRAAAGVRLRYPPEKIHYIKE
ncbi:ABC transporter ATP-binding protein [Bordetella trematum]|uniref:ABC transporter ATP-binding protein n=1 Tax=Bordetella trematum TaxID=123899 RepID=UPI0004726616|nr:ABC transporter ATP-binding protein [Bordetella trematum]